MSILAQNEDEYLDLKKMTTTELTGIIAEADAIKSAAISELDRWSTVRCEVCQRENVAYRDVPFIGWTTSSGRVLCNVCTSRWERKYGGELDGTPVDNPIEEIMALMD